MDIQFTDTCVYCARQFSSEHNPCWNSDGVTDNGAGVQHSNGSCMECDAKRGNVAAKAHMESRKPVRSFKLDLFEGPSTTGYSNSDPFEIDPDAPSWGGRVASITFYLGGVEVGQVFFQDE